MCVVASGPDLLALVRAAHIGLLFAAKIDEDLLSHPQDEEDYYDGAHNERPIGNLSARY